MPPEIIRDAIRYWEVRRLWYNLALTALVSAWVFLTWPHFRPAFTLDSLGKLLILAALANLCYSAAYLIDIPMQQSPSGAASFWSCLAATALDVVGVRHSIRPPCCVLLDRGRDLSLCRRRLTSA